MLIINSVDLVFSTTNSLSYKSSCDVKSNEFKYCDCNLRCQRYNLRQVISRVSLKKQKVFLLLLLAIRRFAIAECAFG